MDLGLKDKVVVVTGGSQGIGLAAVKEYLKEGSKVIFCARDEISIDKVVESIKELGVVEGYKLDMTDEKGVYNFAKYVNDKYSRIDIWINNVGAIGDKKGEIYTEDEIDFVYNACFKSAVFGCQAAYKYMKDEGGSIVNVSSLAARCPSAGRSTLYGPMKAAISNLTITFAGEFAADNIRVNGIMPGFTLTELVKNNISEEELQFNVRGTLLRRLAEPEEIAKPIVFLSSDAASYMMGTIIEVSGGRSITLNPMYAYDK